MGPTITLVSSAPIVFLGKSSQPIWILDFEPNYHMSGKFSAFTSPALSQIVCIANGGLHSHAWPKKCLLSLNITIQSVYHVLKFAYNLLFISRLTKSLN